ncbi:MAG: MFS transporter [Kiloniellales bacterium]
MSGPSAQRPGARRTLGICSAAHALHDGLQDLTYVLLPVLAQSFGLSLAQVGLLRAAQKAAMAGFQLPAGLLAERAGERTLLALGTLIAGLAYLGLGAAGGFASLLLLLFLSGLGHAFQHPLGSAMVSRAFPEGGRRQALGAYNFAGDVGKLAFAGLTSLALIGGLSWRAPVVSFGGLAVLGTVPILVLLGRLEAGSRPVPLARPQNPGSGPGFSPGSWGGSWGIRDRRGFAALCGIAVIDSGTRSGFLTFVAFLLIAKGASEDWATLALPLIFAGGMAGKLACGYLAERIGVVPTVVLTELATGAGILLVVALPNPGAFAILPLLGIALNGTSTVLYGSIGDLVEPERQARAFGLFYTLGSLCGIAAPLGYGLLGDGLGVRAAMVVTGLVVLLVLPLCPLLPRALRRATLPAPQP